MKQIQFLPVELTQEARIDAAVQLSELLTQQAELEQEKKNESKRRQLEIDSLQAQIERLTEVVKTGAEEQEVEVEKVYNMPVRGMYQLIRLDTMEVVEEGDMSQRDKEYAANQLQTKIPMP